MIDTYHELDADVIVIGAGISGLTAAYVLLQKESSLNVLVLEASDKIGGRVASKPLMGKNGSYSLYDTGGQWINVEQKAVIELLEEFGLGIETSVNINGKVIVDFDGKLYKQSRQEPLSFFGVAAKLELARFVTKIEKLCEKATLESDLASMTMKQFLNQNISNKYNKALIKSVIYKNCGVDVSDLTVGFYIFYCISTHGFANQLDFYHNGLHEFWIKNGAQEICSKIAFMLQLDRSIVTKALVKKITSTERDIEIKSTGGTFYCTHVIITVPPSAVGKIKFRPPLPQEKLQAFAQVTEGKLSQFVITYKEAFWTKSGYSGDVHVLNGYSLKKPVVCCFDISTRDNAALMGYAIPNEGDPTVFILQQLGGYFGNQALYPLQFTIEKWVASPMCCYKSLKDMLAVQGKTHRIFWAGAETSLEWYGTICGAIMTGNRAAREVIYDLRPASLTVDDMGHLEPSITEISNRNKVYASGYKKLVDPYFQISAVVVVILIVFVWRRYGVNEHLKRILINR